MDKKTSSVIIISITTEDGKRYVLPNDDKLASRHSKLIETENYKRVKKSLNQRGQERTIWIECTEEMQKIYFDQDDNIMFNNMYLEQEVEENIVESIQKKENQVNLKHISERFLIEKFACKNSNAKQWLQTFERECKRFEIDQDDTKIEVLRLFLDRSCLDWYSATQTTLEIQSGWLEWKEKFLESFADRGWSTGMYATLYKYREGSLMEYAMRKERLLLDMDKNIGTESMVMLIAAGLPEFVRNRIDREICENSTKLLHEIRKCEHLVSKSTFIKRKDEKQENRKKFEEKKPCGNCEGLNKGVRYHPEESCWFKKKNGNYARVIGSNSVVEVDQHTEQKNG